MPTIQIKDGEPVGGIQDLSFDKGEDIKFRVESDAAWEIHFHGYDIPMDVEAGGSVTSTSRRRSRACSRSRSSRPRPRSPRSPSTRSDRPMSSRAPLEVVAHALVGRRDLPIPEWLFAWAASLVLIVSFVALSLAWHRSRFEESEWRPVPGWLSASARQPGHRGRSPARSASSCSGSSSGPGSREPRPRTATSP